MAPRRRHRHRARRSDARRARSVPPLAKGDTTRTNGATGSVTVAAGAAVQGAFVTEVDQQGRALASTRGVIRYTAEATAIP